MIARRSNRAVISFRNADIPLSESLRHLTILLLDREFSETDCQALVTSLKNTRSLCANLESVSVIADAHSWLQHVAFVRKWNLPPVVRYKERIIDLDRKSEVLTCSHMRGLQWERTSHISFPVDRVVELADFVWNIPQVIILSLLPTTEPSMVLNNRRSIIRSVAQLLSHLPHLRKISLPLELSSRIGYLLTIVSSLHHCSAVELGVDTASVIPVNQMSVTSLTAGFCHFDHLRKLGLPAYILCDRLCFCLGELQGLQHLTIMATNPIPAFSSVDATVYGFPALHTLKISGSKALSSDITRAFRAFVLPQNGPLRKVLVDVICLSRRKDIKDTLGVLIQHRGQIRELVVRINGVHASERKSWMDLSLLGSLPHLTKFRIMHPRPLLLTDKDIGSLIRAWPLATFLSFNPRPMLRPWASGSATLNCMTDVVKEGNNLLHFGIYLDPRPPYNGDFCSHQRLRELDLGEVIIDKRTTGQLHKLFPNARRS